MNAPTIPAHSAPVLVDRLALALLVGVAAWLSLTLARLPGSVAAVWVGNGILVGWLLSRPTALWPGYAVAGLATGLLIRLQFFEVLPAMALTVSDLIEVLIVAGSIRRRVPDVGDPKAWIGLGGIATGSTLLACAVSGLLATLTLSAATGVAPLAIFATWYAAHVVGMVIVATLTLVLRREGIRLWDAPGRRADFFACMLLLATVSLAVFSQSTYPFLFLTFPPLLLAAFRHRFAGVIGGVSLLAVIAIIASSLGHGPLVPVEVHSFSDTERILLLQVFLGVACLMSFPVALAMAERGRLTARARESEQRYRMLADYSHDLVLRLSLDGKRLYASPSVKQVMGWTPEELLELERDVVHPDDRAKRQQVVDTVLASGKSGAAIYRVQHKDGHYVWVETVVQLIPGSSGDRSVELMLAARDISQRVAAEQALQASREELEKLARVDSLTGLPNRRQFDERLALAVARSQRPGLPIALMYLDIDHFKQINDSHGHGVGDQVLQVFAERLVGCVRAGDLAARLGGDEFVVLVEDAQLPRAAETIARKLVATMEEDIVVGDVRVRATTSIGIALCPFQTSAHALMSAADTALYDAKHAGRNGWHFVTVEGQQKQ